MNMYVVIFIFLFLYNDPALAVYKCVGGGNVSYQNAPCSSGENGSKIYIDKKAASSETIGNAVDNSDASNDIDSQGRGENCDGKLYGSWKAEWWQNGLDGERTTSFLGDMRWHFLRDNRLDLYSDGFSNSNKNVFSCRDNKIRVLSADGKEELSIINVYSISYGEIIVNEAGRYVHWKRIK